MSWRMSPRFWVRSAGFPFQHLDGLTIDASRGAEGAAGSDRESAFAADLLRIRRRFFELLEDPWVQEALFLSNRQAFERVRSLCRRGADAPLNAKSRQRLRLAWSYLQRLCAKNDTASFFGPIAWGRVEPDAEPLTVTPGSGPWLARRTVRFEHWAIQALADAASRDPALLPDLPIHLVPSVRLDGDRLHVPVDRSMPLRGTSREILETLSAAGAASENELAIAVAERHARDPERIRQGILRLLDKGLLSRRLLIPTVVPRPDARLAEALAGLPAANPARGRWLERLAEIQALGREFETADLDQRLELTRRLDELFARRISDSLEREDGRMYVGRYVFHEECERNLRVTLGPGLLRDVKPVLELVLRAYRAVARELAARLRRAYLAVYREVAGDEDSLDFLRFYRQARELPTTGLAAELRAELATSWRRVVPDPEAEEARLSLDELARWVAGLAAAFTDSTSLPLGCDVHSPDLLIAAADAEAVAQGHFQVILGEVHPAVHTASQPVAMPFCPWPEAVTREVASLLAPSSMVLVDPPATYQRSTINWPDCEPLHEVVPSGCASRLPPARQVPVARGRVRPEGDRLVFADLETGRRDDLLTVMASAFQHLLFQLAPDVLGGGLAPRLTCGPVVLKRRSWTIDGAELPRVDRPAEQARCYFALRDWASRRGLPRWVFFSVAGEPKPLFVDFDNPLAVDLFSKKAKDRPTLTVSEMSPTPDQLWLRDERGAYTCELRTSWYRRESRAATRRE